MNAKATASGESERSPIERALDVGVYAPLGFALEFRRLVPELAEAGRQQVAFSRSLGKAALSTLGKAAAARTSDAPSAAAAPPPAPAKKAAAKNAPAKKAAAKKPAAKKPASGVVEGYDGLTAREIIALSGAATAPQRSWMRKQEQAGKQRKTVLKALEAE